MDKPPPRSIRGGGTMLEGDVALLVAGLPRARDPRRLRGPGRLRALRIEKLNRARVDGQARLLLAVLIFPLIRAELALEQNVRALAEILRAVLRELAPRRDVDETRILAPLARARGEH